MEGLLTSVGHVRFGSKADIGERPVNVRFTPNSGHSLSLLGCPLCAKTRQDAPQQMGPYSITSSARASSAGGRGSPSAFAVLRLIASSYLVGNSTGRSPGFSPLRIRAT